MDELLPGATAHDHDDAVRRLVRRFFAGHGPASVPDLTRWTTLTQREISQALNELGDVLEAVTVDGARLWFDPRSPADETGDTGAPAPSCCRRSTRCSCPIPA